FTTDRRFYSLPRYVNAGGDPLPRYEDTLDRSDGQADGLWQGHALDELTATESPVLGPWQTRLALNILRWERYGRDRITDLFYIHYKSPDHVGHRWNMISPEMNDILRSVDAGIGELVKWLNESVGRKDYVLVVTADHGQTPLQAGGWPISQRELFADIESRFDHVENGDTIIKSSSANVLFADKAEMKVNGVSPEEISSWLTGYTIADNLAIGSSLAEGYEDRGDDLVYSAAFPGRAVTQVAMCTGALGRD
ncbi:MAG: alkaline phosphatase family protein, partial [Actinomycetota bacterium]|nr:alkaline phosphatase family protein [Actinomycetota bacterium]